MSTVTINVTVNGCRVVNAQKYAEQFTARPQWLHEINRLAVECGPMPSNGRFLIQRADYDEHFPDDEAFDIVFTRKVQDAAGAVATTTITATGYYLVSAHAAARIVDSPMIVTVADARHVCRQAVTNRTWNLGTATGKTWANVLTDLKSDLPTDYSDTLAYATNPTGTPYNLIFNGRYSLDALQELASRTRHCLTFDPIAGKLTLANMTGTQAGLAAIISTAEPNLYRPWDPPDTTAADEIGSVKVVFNKISSNYERYEKVIAHPSSTSDNQRLAFGNSLSSGSDASQTNVEAQRLANTWFDWSARRIARSAKQYIGLYSVTCGSQVSRVVWLIENNDLHTIVDQGAPPEPLTQVEQRVSSGSARRLFIGHPRTDPLGGLTPFWSTTFFGAGTQSISSYWKTMWCYGDVPIYNDADKLRIRVDQMGASEVAFEGTITLHGSAYLQGRPLTGALAAFREFKEALLAVRLKIGETIQAADTWTIGRVPQYIRLSTGGPNEAFYWEFTRRFWCKFYQAFPTLSEIYVDLITAAAGDNISTQIDISTLRIDLAEISVAQYNAFLTQSSTTAILPDGAPNNTGTFFGNVSSPPALLLVPGRIIGGGTIAASGIASLTYTRRITSVETEAEASSPAALIEYFEIA